MLLALVVDEQTLERAREAARRQGASLDDLIREYLALLADRAGGDELLEGFQETWREVDESPGGSTPGYCFDRDELYDARLRYGHDDR